MLNTTGGTMCACEESNKSKASWKAQYLDPFIYKQCPNNNSDVTQTFHEIYDFFQIIKIKNIKVKFPSHEMDKISIS